MNFFPLAVRFQRDPDAPEPVLTCPKHGDRLLHMVVLDLRAREMPAGGVFAVIQDVAGVATYCSACQTILWVGPGVITVRAATQEDVAEGVAAMLPAAREPHEA